MHRLRLFFAFTFLSFTGISDAEAHDPLYGLGPHVLFKGGFAPHATFMWNNGYGEMEYALGYGLTRRWTTIVEGVWNIENSSVGYDHFAWKNKYRFWLKNSPGSSKQASLLTKLSSPADDNKPTVLSTAITAGNETLKWYWFAGAGYAIKMGGTGSRSGNNFLYNFTLGYRPIPAEYYKPDLVFFIEATGEFYQKSILNGEHVDQSGGPTLSVAPTFFFTYRNLAIRGGVQYGIAAGEYLSINNTSYKLTIELHI